MFWEVKFTRDCVVNDAQHAIPHAHSHVNFTNQKKLSRYAYEYFVSLKMSVSYTKLFFTFQVSEIWLLSSEI